MRGSLSTMEPVGVEREERSSLDVLLLVVRSLLMYREGKGAIWASSFKDHTVLAAVVVVGRYCSPCLQYRDLYQPSHLVV